MTSKRVLITSGVIAAVAATALLIPGLAFGQPIGVLPLVPGTFTSDVDGRPGDGQGRAWGHHKDSDDFPGQGRGLDKDSDDFPGQGRGLDKDKNKDD
jgi:hypothetical protein